MSSVRQFNGYDKKVVNQTLFTKGKFYVRYSKQIAKTLITAMTLVAVSSTAMAHDPKFHSEKDRNNCENQKLPKQMDAMDHSNMDMSNPSAKAMMQKMEKMHTVYNAHCLST